MLIDAHHHLWDLQRVEYPWLMERGKKRFFGDPEPIQRDFLIEEFRSLAEPAGIGASVHVQVGARDPMQEARWVQLVADENPTWPMAQVAFCDLTSDSCDSDLDGLSQLRSVAGIRQIVGRSTEEDLRTGTNNLLDDPSFAHGLRRAARHGFSFDLQLTPGLIAPAARLLSAFDDLPVILCHCGSPSDWSEEGLAYWRHSLRQLAELPRVYVKLSGLGMFCPDWTTENVRPIIESCLELFGPDRCMFGSNFPVDSLCTTYGSIVESLRQIVPAECHSAVFGETARRVYCL